MSPYLLSPNQKDTFYNDNTVIPNLLLDKDEKNDWF